MKRNLSWVCLCLTFLIVGFLSGRISSPTESQGKYLANGQYSVSHVTDGDTFVFLSGRDKEKARLMGINTPETKDPRTEVQCFGPEAADTVKQLLDTRTVRLEFNVWVRDRKAGSPTNKRDKYGRLLVYVYTTQAIRLSNGTQLPQGLLVNQWLIQEGYAREDAYGDTHRLKDKFETAEAHAKATSKGMWKNPACAKESNRS